MYFVIEKKAPYGVYHLSNEGSCSWYGFAQEILKDYTEVTILPVRSEEFSQKAQRPKNSVMSLDKAKELGFLIPDFQDMLDEILNRIQ